MKKAAFFALCVLTVCLSVRTTTVGAECGLTIITDGGRYEFSYPELKRTLGGYRLSGEKDIINGIASDLYIPATDAEITFSPDSERVFTFKKEAVGRALDEEELMEDLRSALTVGGGAVYAKCRAIEPKTRVSDLKKQTFEKARFTTYFESSNVERSANIALAAKTLSGTRIKPGETFSFNAAVGVRSEERGYKTAKIIKNGKFEEGLGGGVCQVSTTLYNAALTAGLKIAEYHPHTLAVSYIENSFDAMVSYGSADLKIENDTDGEIFIAAYVREGSITFVLFGTKNECSISRKSVTESVVYAENSYVDADDLAVGENRVVTKSKNGAVSKGYLIVEKNGKREKKLIRSDVYKAVNGVVERGTRIETDDIVSDIKKD